MGVLRIVALAVLGPLVLYFVLFGHVICRHFLQEAEPIEIQEFSKDIAKDLKDSIVSSRKPLIKELMDALAGKIDGNKFADKWLTEDADFEDPLQRSSGRGGWKNLLKMGKSLFATAEFEIHGEYHGSHEILLDWTITTTLRMMPNYPVPLRMRARILLEPAAKAGATEKCFKYIEEWNGVKLLNEKTTFPLLGKVHSKLRSYAGNLGSAIVQKGWV